MIKQVFITSMRGYLTAQGLNDLENCNLIINSQKKTAKVFYKDKDNTASIDLDYENAQSFKDILITIIKEKCEFDELEALTFLLDFVKSTVRIQVYYLKGEEKKQTFVDL